MRVAYNLLLVLGLLLSLPSILWKAFKYKKYRGNFLQRLGLKLPAFPSIKGPSIWIHGVSLGETKAATPLIKKIHQERPGISLVFSSSTETGLQEGQKNLPFCVSHFLLPLDFSWTMKKLSQKIKPGYLILVEGDFWYNLMQTSPSVILINGKISEKSAKRFRFFSFFAKRLFSFLKLLCVQSDLYKERFCSLGISADKIIVTGNLKFDQVMPKINLEEGRRKFGLTEKDQVITLGSTHAPEEEELLEALNPLFLKFPHLKILLVPRHPERFSSVAYLIEKKGIPFARYSDPEFLLKAKEAKVILIDAMGSLGACYQLSQIAIVAGSLGSELGGHNIFEPVSVGTPVLFGPHMHSQKDLVDLVLSSKVGKQVTLSELSCVVQDFLENPPLSMKKAALDLAGKMQGSTQRTWDKIKLYLNQGFC